MLFIMENGWSIYVSDLFLYEMLFFHVAGHDLLSIIWIYPHASVAAVECIVSPHGAMENVMLRKQKFSQL